MRVTDRLWAAARLAREQGEGVTYQTCPVCDGHGGNLIENPNGLYFRRMCRWCQGIGCVPGSIFDLYFRWQRIARKNGCRRQ